ncbi:MAG: FGGY-family carbohydrate kinase, partial [Eubacterium sp.]
TFALRDTIEICREFGIDVNEVRANGGGAKSELWRQMQADIYNRPCETVEVEEATALGCAMVAAVGVGVYKDYDEAAKNMVKITKRYEPNPEIAKRYEDAYQTWKKIYRALSGDAFDAVTAFQEKYR